MKRLQIFIHKYYDSIKLILLLCILTLVTYSLLSQIQLNAAESKERGEAVIAISEQIQKESEKTRQESERQTEVINRQFQALCFLIIETSGAEALKQLDPPLEEQCRNLASELQQQERQEPAAGPTAAPAVIAPSNEAPAPTVQAPTTSSPPDPEPNPQQPGRSSFIDGLLKSLGVR